MTTSEAKDDARRVGLYDRDTRKFFGRSYPFSALGVAQRDRDRLPNRDRVAVREIK